VNRDFDCYFRNLFHFEFGNLDKIHSFLTRFLERKSASESGVTVTELRTSFRLEGPGLIAHISRWNELNAAVLRAVGPVLNAHPVISLAKTHIHRRQELRAQVTVGLWNVHSTTTCFWREADLVAHARYDVGDALLLNARESHSVVFNDTFLQFTPRATLIWDCAEDFPLPTNP
jgi:hypothetical protein